MVRQIPRSLNLLFRITIVEAPQPYGYFEVKGITQYSYVRFVNLVNSFRCLLFCREIFRLPTQNFINIERKMTRHSNILRNDREQLQKRET